METPGRAVKTLVLGLGNPLLGDDGFGRCVIERLRLEGAGLSADLVDAHTDLLAHIDRFAMYKKVVLVDAILVPEVNVTGSSLVVSLEEERMEAWPDASPGVHQLSPLLAVRLYRRLHPNAATRIHLVGLMTARLSLGSGCLTAEAIAEGARKVRELVAED